MKRSLGCLLYEITLSKTFIESEVEIQKEESLREKIENDEIASGFIKQILKQTLKKNSLERISVEKTLKSI